MVSASLIALDMGSATFLPCFILNPTEYLFFPLTCRLLTKMEGKKGEGELFSDVKLARNWRAFSDGLERDFGRGREKD